MSRRRPLAAALLAATLLAVQPAQAQVSSAQVSSAPQTPSAEVLTRLLGPLAPQGMVGRAGDWEMAVADDSYVLANRGAPYGARFVSTAATGGPLSIAAEVQSAPGNAPADALVGAGLLFDVQGAGAARRFALVLVERSGEVGLFRGDATGVKKVEGRSLPGATGFVRLAAVEAGGQIVVTANGVRVATAPAAATAGTRIGIAAIGPGRFAFRGVRLGPDPATVAAGPARFGRIEARLPGGWDAALADSGAWTARGPDGARAVWWPFRSRGPVPDETLPALLADLVRAQDAGLEVGTPESRASGLSAPLRRDGRVAGRAWIGRSTDGAGTFAMADAGAWTTERAGAAATVLAGLRLVGQPPAAPAATRSFRWSDPAGGFSAELPQGWTVTGGTQSARDGAPAWMVGATSPDGASRIFLGDPELPLFVLPTERLKAAGITEGQTFRHGDGTPVLVARLMPGLGFAEIQGMRMLAGRCTDEPKTEYRRRRADLAGPLGRALMPAPPQGELEAGEVALSCSGKDGPIAAHVIAATDGIAGRGQGAWSAPVLLGFVAPRERVPAALGALGTLVASIRPSATALLGRSEDAELRNEAAARVAAAVVAGWWAERGRGEAGPRPIATLPGGLPPIEGDRAQGWLAEGPAPAVDWRAALAP